MRTKFFLLGLLVLVAAALVVALVRFKAETAALRAEGDALRSADAAQSSQRSALERRLVESQGAIVERKRAVLVSLSAADRARAAVGPLVERLKAAQAGRPTVPSLPPPPTAAGGGMFFPELMSDPEYSRLYARVQRNFIARRVGGVLRGLGVNEESIEKAVDLLAEEQTSSMDLHNLTGTTPGGGMSGSVAQLRHQQVEETQKQLKALLGDEVYQRYKYETQGVGAQLKYATDNLERRLYYSEQPLTPEQRARLQSYEATQDYGSRQYFQKVAQVDREARKTGVIPVDEAKLAFYRSVLTPRQMEAVDELHREREAALKRELLPKYQEKKSAGKK